MATDEARFWPGKEPDIVCADHAMDSQKVAEAMGFPLTLVPISYRASYRAGEPPPEFPTCCCSKGFSQTIEIEPA